ncbi:MULTISPECIES: thioredoxin [Enterococcaceae]|uniref:thioredoxin n=1 Tax=Enterococcaceae TaxID=81852 RepID=UPI000E4E6573|nr:MULTISPECIES: thioredoxin [Enterococcaceae]MCI0130426.1 thioredoxin [Vagococcus sp. CY53-2]RGI32154.1 thioredoxin [Melissococcus sp. OM08-11BH]UNM89861.1 thioredoxin [Vagococcus sp. CY52-2]
MVENITDANFAAETDEGLVLVDFWAPWCGPCRMQGPILDGIATEYQDKVKIVKVNVDENPQTSQAHGIMSIPTLLLKKDGQVVEQMVGVQQKPQLEQVFNKYL